MVKFTKNDLAYSGYKDTARPDDDPRLTGEPDSTMLNRNESYEMVYFINRYMNTTGLTSKADFQKIENFLQTSKHAGESHKFWRDELKKNLN